MASFTGKFYFDKDEGRYTTTPTSTYFQVIVTYSTSETATSHTLKVSKITATAVGWNFLIAPETTKLTYDGNDIWIRHGSDKALARGESFTWSGLSTTSTTTKTHAQQSKTLRFVYNGLAASYGIGAAAGITIAPKTSYNVAYANGGGGTAPSAQTKWCNETLALRPAITNRTNYVFKNWKASNGTTYSAGGNYTANAATTMTAQWYAPYTVRYDGNGSTGGSTASQTKVHNTALTVSANGFTRTNYAFSNWNSKADGSGTSYTAGSSKYTANASATLYARWTQVYASPSLTIKKVYRADSNGDVADEGAYLALEASYSIYDADGNAISSWSATCNGVTSSTPASGGTGVSGTVKFVIAANLSVESAYNVSLSLTDTNGGTSGRSSATTTKTAQLGSAAYPLDFKRFDDGIYGVAIGGVATRRGLDVFGDAYFRSENMHLDNVGDHFFVFPNTDTSGNPTVTHWRTTFTGYGNLRLDKSTDGGSTWTLGTRYFASEDRVWPLDKGGTGATTAAGARTALGLGSFATRSSLGLGVAAKDGSVKDSSARSSGANYEIDITLAAESGYMPLTVLAVTTNSGQAVLRGFDLDGLSTGGTPKVKTYWHANAAMSANTVTYTAQVMLIKTTLP